MTHDSRTCRQSVVAGAVVVRHNRALLLQRSADETYPGMWELPSGGRECGEGLLATVGRETLEESGLVVVHSDYLGDFTYDKNREGGVVHSIQLNFRVTVEDGDVVLSAEHGAHAWVHLDELGQYDMSPETRQVVEQALQA